MKTRHWSTEKISRCILYALVGIIVLMYVLFALIGFDMPYEENMNFNAPLFTDALIILTGLLLLGTIVIAIGSVIRSYKESPREKENNGIPYRRISICIGIGVLVILVVTFALGSSTPMTINGEVYSDRVWLKVADMFVFTAIILLVVSIAAMIFGATRYNRRGKQA